MTRHVFIIIILALTVSVYSEPETEMTGNDSSSEKVVETVILEDGRIFRGNFYGEKEGTIEFVTENGKTELINKSDILRVLYENLTDEQAQQVYKEEIAKKKQEEPKPAITVSDKVYFRNGSTMRGKVLSQKRDFVVLQTKAGREVRLNKDNILRVKFRVAETAEDAITEISQPAVSEISQKAVSETAPDNNSSQTEAPDVTVTSDKADPEPMNTGEAGAKENKNNGVLKETVYLKDGSTVKGTINHGSSIISVTTSDKKVITIDKKNILKIDFEIIK